MGNVNAEVVTIGNELLSGTVLNTNAAFLGDRLGQIGIALEWITSVGDQPDHIAQAFRQAMGRARVVIVTGGLGPTHDDVTKQVFADLLGRKLILEDAILEHVRARFAHRGVEMPASNVVQAMIPEGVEVLENRWGTAPGLYAVETAPEEAAFREEDRHIFLLPGVPREMRGLFEHGVVPRLRALGGERMISHTLRTTGISESALYERLRDLPEIEQVAFLPGLDGVDVRITMGGAEVPLHAVAGKLRARMGTFVYGVDEESIEEIVGNALRTKGWRIAVAESCTGGLIVSRLTDVPGSSDYVEGGVIAYSNRAKTALLGVPEALIGKHGAVSGPVAEAMASGVRDRFGVDIGLAVTGIVGPTGGTPEKPVGFVCMGVSTDQKTFFRRFQFGTERTVNKRRSSQAALDLVRRVLGGEEV